MADTTTISVNGLDVGYVREHERKTIGYAKISSICFFLLMIIASACLFIYQISDGNIIYELYRYMRIKNTVKSWKPIIAAKSRIDGERGRQLSNSRPELKEFRCVDFGAYFMPVRINELSYLPQAIRRGKGDGWAITKAAKVDVSAQQFCEYVSRKYNNNIITCGAELFSELGYGGYFDNGHWCHNILDILT